MSEANIANLCMGCFTQHQAPAGICPVCGYNEAAQALSPHQLRPRTILNGKYLVGRTLGEGGFGITYIGWDLNLHLKVAIKEFYPNGFVTRENTVTSTVQPYAGTQGDFFHKGRGRFIEEAKSLAKFRSLPGIVMVNEFFLENGTAYIVMEYIDGKTMKAYLADMGGRIPAAQAFDMMRPVMDSLAKVHQHGMIHRDISPDNIMISREGYLKLLDFGAAREFEESGNRSMSIMLKPGFAPEEQYRSRGTQGPWTDIYALCATIYRAVTGVTPDESSERMRQDALKAPSALGVAIHPAQEAALMKGMAVLQENRWQSVPELYTALYGTPAPGPVAPPPVYTQPQQPVYTPPPPPVYTPPPPPPPVYTPPTPPPYAGPVSAPPAGPQPVYQPVVSEPTGPQPVYTPPSGGKRSFKLAGIIAACLVVVAGAVVAVLFLLGSDEKDPSLEAPVTPSPSVAAPPSSLPSQSAPSPSDSLPVVGGDETSPDPAEPSAEQPSPSAEQPSPSAEQPSPSAAQPSPSPAQPSPSPALPSPSPAQPSPSPAQPSPSPAQPSPSPAASPSAAPSSDLKNGYDVEYYTDGSKYEGNFVDGVREGKGRYTWPDGDNYYGDFKNGIMDGQGVYTWADGRTWVGSFRRDTRHGNGVYTDGNGDVYDEVYNNGALVSSTKR